MWCATQGDGALEASDSDSGSSAVGCSAIVASWNCTLGISAFASWRRMSSWRSSSVLLSKFVMFDAEVVCLAMFGKRAATSAGASAWKKSALASPTRASDNFLTIRAAIRFSIWSELRLRSALACANCVRFRAAWHSTNG